MRHLEDQHQAALFKWAFCIPLTGKYVKPKSRLSDYLIAIPNGGKRNLREARRLKGMGVRAGVSDIFLPIPNDTYPGMWIELKKPRAAFKTPNAAAKAVTDLQMDWLERMGIAGYANRVCYGWMEARDEIVRYLT